MTLKEMRNNYRYIHGINFNGNKKLRNTADTRFMIWNIPAVVTCPYATEHCKSACYARKAERVYPQVLPSREINYRLTRTTTFAENMIFTIRTEMGSKAYAGKKIVFRIHESGDFYNVTYLRKWVEIARAFEGENIVFLAYTKSVYFLPQVGYGTDEWPSNLVIRSSIWDDTKENAVKLTQVLHIPVYTALSAEDMGKAEADGLKFEKCPCDDCAKCGKCWNKDIDTIITYIH